MVSVNCLAHFPNLDQRHLLLSGSYDSQVKQWDLRQKQAIAVFKGHTMQINTIQVSPDGRWFVSGSQDSLVKVTLNRNINVVMGYFEWKMYANI